MADWFGEYMSVLHDELSIHKPNNLGTGKGRSVLEAIHAFEKVSGIKLNYAIGPRRNGDVIAIYANNTEAKTDLNWNPKYNIDDMMLSAWKWQGNQ